MNIVLRIARVVLSFIILFLTIIFLDNIDGFLVGEFYGGIDLIRWWNEFVEYKTINFFLATFFLSCSLSLIWEIIFKFATTIYKVVIGEILGILSLIIINEIYWRYIQKTCFEVEWLFLAEAYEKAFGSLDMTKKFFFINMCIYLCVGIFINHFDCFIKNPVLKTAWLQVLYDENLYLSLLCFYIPILIIITGTYFVTGFLGYPIEEFSSLLVGCMLLIDIFIKLLYYFKIVRYYKKILNNIENGYLVVVKESSVNLKSFLYHSILKNEENIRLMDTKKIYFLPENLKPINVKYFIKLDIFDIWIFLENESNREYIIDDMFHERGILNIAFSEIKEFAVKIQSIYDKSVDNVKEVYTGIMLLADYMEYKRGQEEIISKIYFSKLKKTNCIIDEIIQFREYLNRHIDEFLVFDFTIKWLEIINYIYTLIAISRKDVAVTDEIIDLIKNGDFAKWRKIREQIIWDMNEIYYSLHQKIEDDSIFEEFNQLWGEVTSGRYNFIEYSVSELLEAANKLRDYTRGHGVYSFKITQDINLILIEILVFLINHLIEEGLLEGNFDNLERLGWLVYSEGSPYFLYTYNDKYQEYRFDSFQNGNSIVLVLDDKGK